MLKYRKNASVVVFYKNKFLIVCKKSRSFGGKFWQFIQGGIEKNESPIQAIKRELREETGLTKIKILFKSKHANKYDWPKNLQKERNLRGQKQQFFFVELIKKQKIKINKNELIAFKWAEKKELLKLFKISNQIRLAKKLLTELEKFKKY